MRERILIEPPKHTPEADHAIAAFHADTVSEVAATVAREPVVVVGMAQNPYVKKARRALDEASIAYTYLEYGSYLGEWKRRLAVKLWSGWPTFPQVYVGGALLGGNDELRAALADGSLRRRLAGSPDA